MSIAYNVVINRLITFLEEMHGYRPTGHLEEDLALPRPRDAFASESFFVDDSEEARRAEQGAENTGAAAAVDPAPINSVAYTHGESSEGRRLQALRSLVLSGKAGLDGVEFSVSKPTEDPSNVAALALSLCLDPSVTLQGLLEALFNGAPSLLVPVDPSLTTASATADGETNQDALIQRLLGAVTSSIVSHLASQDATDEAKLASDLKSEGDAQAHLFAAFGSATRHCNGAEVGALVAQWTDSLGGDVDKEPSKALALVLVLSLLSTQAEAALIRDASREIRDFVSACMVASLHSISEFLSAASKTTTTTNSAKCTAKPDATKLKVSCKDKDSKKTEWRYPLFFTQAHEEVTLTTQDGCGGITATVLGASTSDSAVKTEATIKLPAESTNTLNLNDLCLPGAHRIVLIQGTGELTLTVQTTASLSSLPSWKDLVVGAMETLLLTTTRGFLGVEHAPIHELKEEKDEKPKEGEDKEAAEKRRKEEEEASAKEKAEKKNEEKENESITMYPVMAGGARAKGESAPSSVAAEKVLAEDDSVNMDLKKLYMSSRTQEANRPLVRSVYAVLLLHVPPSEAQAEIGKQWVLKWMPALQGEINRPAKDYLVELCAWVVANVAPTFNKDTYKAAVDKTNRLSAKVLNHLFSLLFAHHALEGLGAELARRDASCAVASKALNVVMNHVIAAPNRFTSAGVSLLADWLIQPDKESDDAEAASASFLNRFYGAAAATLAAMEQDVRTFLVHLLENVVRPALDGGSPTAVKVLRLLGHPWGENFGKGETFGKLMDAIDAMASRALQIPATTTDLSVQDADATAVPRLLPNSFFSTKAGVHISESPNGISVERTGMDSFSLKGLHPWATGTSLVGKPESYFFEIKVDSNSVKQLLFGLAVGKVDVSKFEASSYGANTLYALDSHNPNTPFLLKKGDTLSCGYQPAKSEARFYMNGVLVHVLAVVSKKTELTMPDELFPFVLYDTRDRSSLVINFGSAQFLTPSSFLPASSSTAAALLALEQSLRLKARFGSQDESSAAEVRFLKTVDLAAKQADGVAGGTILCRRMLDLLAADWKNVVAPHVMNLEEAEEAEKLFVQTAKLLQAASKVKNGTTDSAISVLCNTLVAICQKFVTGASDDATVEDLLATLWTAAKKSEPNGVNPAKPKPSSTTSSPVKTAGGATSPAQAQPEELAPWYPHWTVANEETSFISGAMVKIQEEQKFTHALGPVLPKAGVVSFSVIIKTLSSDMRGLSQMGQFYLGVTSTSLSELSGNGWKSQDPPSVWALHSMKFPQLSHCNISSLGIDPLIFSSGMTVKCTVDREKGTMTVERGSRKFVEVFRNIPQTANLRPMVQLVGEGTSAIFLGGEQTNFASENALVGSSAVTALRVMATHPTFAKRLSSRLVAEMSNSSPGTIPWRSLSILGAIPDPSRMLLVHLGGNTLVKVLSLYAGGRALVQSSEGMEPISVAVASLRPPDEVLSYAPLALTDDGTTILSEALEDQGVGPVTLEGLSTALSAVVKKLSAWTHGGISRGILEGDESDKRQMIQQEETEGWSQSTAVIRAFTFKEVNKKNATLMTSVLQSPPLPQCNTFSLTATSPEVILPRHYQGHLMLTPSDFGISGPFVAVANEAVATTGTTTFRVKLWEDWQGMLPFTPEAPFKLTSGCLVGLCSESYHAQRRRHRRVTGEPDMWAVPSKDKKEDHLQHSVKGIHSNVHLLRSRDTVRIVVNRSKGTMEAFRTPVGGKEEPLGLWYDNLPENVPLYPFVQLKSTRMAALFLPENASLPRPSNNLPRYAHLLAESEPVYCDGCANQMVDCKLSAPNWYHCNQCADVDLCENCFKTHFHVGHEFTHLRPTSFFPSPVQNLSVCKRNTDVELSGAAVQLLNTHNSTADASAFNCIAKSTGHKAFMMWGAHRRCSPSAVWETQAVFRSLTGDASATGTESEAGSLLVLGLAPLSKIQGLDFDGLLALLRSTSTADARDGNPAAVAMTNQESVSEEIITTESQVVTRVIGRTLDFGDLLQVSLRNSDQLTFIKNGCPVFTQTVKGWGTEPLVVFALVESAGVEVDLTPAHAPYMPAKVGEIASLSKCIRVSQASSNQNRWCAISEVRSPLAPVKSLNCLKVGQTVYVATVGASSLTSAVLVRMTTSDMPIIVHDGFAEIEVPLPTVFVTTQENVEPDTEDDHSPWPEEKGRLRRYYAKYAPEKSDVEMDKALQVYSRHPKGHAQMFEDLVKKYGPEPEKFIDVVMKTTNSTSILASEAFTVSRLLLAVRGLWGATNQSANAYDTEGKDLMTKTIVALSSTFVMLSTATNASDHGNKNSGSEEASGIGGAAVNITALEASTSHCFSKEKHVNFRGRQGANDKTVVADGQLVVVAAGADKGTVLRAKVDTQGAVTFSSIADGSDVELPLSAVIPATSASGATQALWNEEKPTLQHSVQFTSSPSWTGKCRAATGFHFALSLEGGGDKCQISYVPKVALAKGVTLTTGAISSKVTSQVLGTTQFLLTVPQGETHVSQGQLTDGSPLTAELAWSTVAEHLESATQIYSTSARRRECPGKEAGTGNTVLMKIDLWTKSNGTLQGHWTLPCGNTGSVTFKPNYSEQTAPVVQILPDVVKVSEAALDAKTEMNGQETETEALSQMIPSLALELQAKAMEAGEIPSASHLLSQLLSLQDPATIRTVLRAVAQGQPATLIHVIQQLMVRCRTASVFTSLACSRILAQLPEVSSPEMNGCDDHFFWPAFAAVIAVAHRHSNVYSAVANVSNFVQKKPTHPLTGALCAPLYAHFTNEYTEGSGSAKLLSVAASAFSVLNTHSPAASSYMQKPQLPLSQLSFLSDFAQSVAAGTSVPKCADEHSLETKNKLKQLVKAYAVAIKSGNIDEVSFLDRFPEGHASHVKSVADIPATELTRTALQLAGDAFKAPLYRYYFKEPPAEIDVSTFHVGDNETNTARMTWKPLTKTSEVHGDRLKTGRVVSSVKLNLAQGAATSAGRKLYYEVHVPEGCRAVIGYCNQSYCQFSGATLELDLFKKEHKPIGYTDNAIGFDGAGYMHALDYVDYGWCEAREGDAIGCALDLDNKTISWSVNGQQFDSISLPESLVQPGTTPGSKKQNVLLSPVVSATTNPDGMQIVTKAENLYYLPAGYSALQSRDTVSAAGYNEADRSKVAAKDVDFYKDLSAWLSADDAKKNEKEKKDEEKDEKKDGEGESKKEKPEEAKPGREKKGKIADMSDDALVPYTQHIDLVETCLVNCKPLLDLSQSEGPLITMFTTLKKIISKRVREDHFAQFPPLAQEGSPMALSQVTVRWYPLFSKSSRTPEAALQQSILGQLYRQMGNGTKLLHQNPMFRTALMMNDDGHVPIDAGGPYNQVWALLSEEIMSDGDRANFHRNPLFRFVSNSHGKSLVPDRKRSTPIDLSIFTFLGSIMGHMVRAKAPIALEISPFVWKFLVEEPVTISDYYSDVEPYFKAPIDSGDYSLIEQEYPKQFESFNKEFNQSPTYARLGEDLIQKLAAEACLVHSMDQQLHALREGLWKLLSRECVRALSGTELELLVCGEAEPTFEQVKESIGCTLPEPHQTYFWEAMKELTPKDWSDFFYFAAAQKRYPLTKKITVQPSGQSMQHSPTASTCFAQIQIPLYTSKKMMLEKLKQCIICQDMELA